jgi:subtilisin-like proprotein convertase family protein
MSRRPGFVASGVPLLTAFVAAVALTMSPIVALNGGPVTNVLVNDPAADLTAQDTQTTPTIALGAGGVILGAFNDSGSAVGGALQRTGWARSSTGGQTWTDRGTLPLGAGGDGGDPSIARDAFTGRIYLATRMLTAVGVQLFRSDDNGGSFQSPLNAAPGVGGGDMLGRPSIAVDNFLGAGQGNVYLATYTLEANGPLPRGKDVYFFRSTDAGTTWGPSGGVLIDAAPGFAAGPAVIVGPDHAVYVFYVREPAPTDATTRIRMRKSTDGGASFGPERNVSSLTAIALNGGLPHHSFPAVASNPVTGDLYLAYGGSGDIRFRQSSNGGETWGVPQIGAILDTLTLAGGDADQFLPAITITPNGSHVMASWYDRQLDPDNSRIDYFGRIGTITGSVITWGSPFRISTKSYPAVAGQDPAAAGFYMGGQVTADDSFFYVVWSDNRLSNSFHANQPDIRFAKVPVAGPGPILWVESSPVLGGNGDDVLQANECVDLKVRLRNLGTSTATGLSATLTSTTDGLTIDAATASYPDIPPGGFADNVTPFRISSGGSWFCGTAIDFVLDVTTATGPFQLQWKHTNPAPAAPANQWDNNTPLGVPDGVNTVESEIAVAGFTGTLADVRVSLYLTHTTGDLSLTLIAPDGTAIDLSSKNGSALSYGAGCSQADRTTFDDTAMTSITDAFAMTGTFRPEQPLSTFDNKSGDAVNGTWRLRITDDYYSGSGGVLACWSLFLAEASCADGGGVCSSGAFGKLSPADGTIQQSTTATLQWQPSAGAAGYEYCVDTSANALCDTQWIDAGLNTSATISGLAPATTYWWQVRTAGGGEEATGSKWWALSVGSGPFKKLSPLSLAFTFTTLTWEPSAGATGYEYCLDASKLGGNEICDSGWVNVGTATSHEVGPLIDGIPYYWQVRTTGVPIEADDGEWRTFKRYSTKFVKQQPFDKASNVSASPDLRWDPFEYFASYEYCIDTSNNDQCDSSWVVVGNKEHHVALAGLAAATTYYWQVRIAGEQILAMDPWWSFTTAAAAPSEPETPTDSEPLPASPPAPPSPEVVSTSTAPRGLSAAADGSVVDLRWNPPESGDVSVYRVELGRSSGETHSTIETGPSTFLSTTALAAGQWFARVRAVVDSGLSPESNEVSFVLTGAPSTPRDFAATLSGHWVVFSWEPPVAGTVIGYVIEAGTAQGLTNLALISIGPLTSFSAEVPEGTYFARLRATNAAGAGNASAEVSFSAGAGSATPGPPQQLQAELSGTSVLLRWAPPRTGDAPVGYVLEAGSAAGLSDLLILPVSGTSFAATVSQPGKYFVRVRGVNSAGVGPPSEQASFTIGGPIVPPDPPSNLAAIIVGDTVTLRWSPSSGSPTSYAIVVGSATGERDVGVYAVGVTTTFSATLVPSGTYWVSVIAANAAGVSGPSEYVRVVVP